MRGAGAGARALALVTVAVAVAVVCCCSLVSGTITFGAVVWPAGSPPHTSIRVVTASSSSELDALVMLHGGGGGAAVAAAAANGSYDDTIASNGWSTLKVSSNPAFNDSAQAFAAGYLEGQLTAHRIFEFLTNIYGLTSPFSHKLTQFLDDNTKWIQNQIALHQHDDPYWYQVSLLYAQLEGVYKGYIEASPKHEQAGWHTFYGATLMGDMDDLCTVYGCNANGASNSAAPESDDFSSSASSSVPREKVGDGHCSVLIKPTKDGQELYFGHVTWSTFETMTRIYKHYDFPWSLSGAGANANVAVAARHITFPSYPGCVFSNDDWYQTSAGLAITETTINNNNASLWQYVHPHTVLDWARNMVANRMAHSGAEWGALFSRYNSGTYNNQFMVVDYKLFSPGQPLPAVGLLTVLEQMPGYIVQEDQSAWLASKGYWSSYNRPFYPAIFNISNQQALVDKHGDHFSWSKTARAVLFASLQGGVSTEADFRAVMRHNNFQNDPIGTQGCTSGRSASNAISERGDLTLASSGCIHDIGALDEAGTDGKYTTNAMMKSGRLTVNAQSGPTFDQQPPFKWSTSPYHHKSHIGQPDEFKFPWVQFDWDL